MKDQNKTRAQLLSELAELRQRVTELETAEAERKLAEEALRASEERLRRLVESATDYIYTVKIEAGHPVATTHGPGCVTVTRERRRP